MGRIVLRGGTIADGPRKPAFAADVAVAAGEIHCVGKVSAEPDDLVIDCRERVVMPGLIDAHSHAEAAVFDPAVALALLRQGVTSVITGQDGVSFAPGDGTYATQYFAALNGAHPGYSGGGVAALLAGYDDVIPLNVGYLVPHGTVRHEVMGAADRSPGAAELQRMSRLVAAGLADGALGLSTGLDYAPGYFADTAELIAVARPVAEVGAIYVSHMRGGYESNIGPGLAEVVEIATATGVSVHVSHLHGPAALIGTELAAARSAGADVSFDAYPYRRGCSLLAMPMLPPALLRLGSAAAADRLQDPTERGPGLRDWLPVMESRPDIGPGWADGITLAGIGAPEYRWAQGLTVGQAAARVGVP